MSSGKTFGKFVAEGPLPGQGRQVLLAHQRGSQELGGYVIKIVSVRETGGEESGAVARRWLDGISFQDRVSQDWHDVVAPIVDRPTKAAEVLEALNSGEVWYVTRRYDGSLGDVLDKLGGASAPAQKIWMICRAVARGAVACKQVDAPGGGRRSHGNLTPGNVLIKDLSITEGKSEIVISDPAPVLLEGQALDVGKVEREFEERDLQALGRILYQLVAGKRLDDRWDWSNAWNVPEGDANRWKQALGKGAGAWRALCQELLATNADRRPSLVDVDHRIVELRPRAAASKVPLIATVCAVVLGILLGVWWGLRDTAAVIVVQLPGIPGISADVSVFPTGDPTKTQTLPLVDGQASFKVPPDEYRIALKPTGAFRRLNPPESQRRAVESRRQVTNLFSLEMAVLRVRATSPDGGPVAGQLVLAGETNGTRLLPAEPTPLYLPYITNKLYDIDVKPDADSGFSPAQLSVLLNRVQSSITTNMILMPALAGMADVKFGSDFDLPLTYTYVNAGGEEVIRTDSFWEKFRRGETVSVKLQPPYPWPAIVTNWVVPETNVVEFPRAISKSTRLRFSWGGNDPARTELLVGSPNSEPVSLGNLIDRQLMAFPPDNASYQFVYQRGGFEGLTNLIEIVGGITNEIVVPELKAIFGSVELSGNLPGIRVYTNGILVASSETTNLTVRLPPGVPHDLALVYSNDFGVLTSQSLRAQVGAGATTNATVRFDFVRVEFAVEPAAASIGRVLEDGSVAPLSRPYYLQDPGARNLFRFTAEHYKSVDRLASLPSGGALPVPVVLEPVLYPVVLQVDPPTATLRNAQDKLGVGVGATSLKFGTYELEAWHPLLGSETKSFTIDPLIVRTHRWDLVYGAVDVLTGQEGLKVKLFPEDPALSERLKDLDYAWPTEDFSGTWVTPVTNAFLPPGKYRIEFSDDEQKATREFEVARRSSPTSAPTVFSFTEVQFLPSFFDSEPGVRLMKLPGESAYLMLVRVTRGRFNQILDPGLPRTEYFDSLAVSRDTRDLPLASIPNILEYCRKLTERDRPRFQAAFKDSAWAYDLPTFAEWSKGGALAGFESTSTTSEFVRKELGEDSYLYAEKGRTSGDPVPAAGRDNGHHDVTFRVVLRKLRP